MKKDVTSEDYGLICDAIDIDKSWQHSWHLNVFMANQKTLNKKLLDIIEEKINKRNEEIEFLNKVKNILLNLELIEDSKEFNYDYKSNEDDLPF
jgi:hypothetical protein